MKKIGKLFNHRYRIASARAQWWNYGWNGAYFITICTSNREHFFGHIKNKIMIVTPAGKCAYDSWLNIPKHFPFVELGEFVVMPNHVHGIIIINKMNTKSKMEDPIILQTRNEFGPQSQNMGSIIRGYKIGVTKYCKNKNILFGWQTRYHDHIIRDQNEFERISKYIRNNPLNWKKDGFFKK